MTTPETDDRTAAKAVWTTPVIDRLGSMDDVRASQEANNDGDLLGQNMAGS